MHLVKLAMQGCRGGDSCPTDAASAAFNAVVHECWTKAPDACILVFDEHGFSRAGALIVRYA